ncbi:HD domain-containing protein [Leptolyngbya sp. FACHB-17]|uniref:HD domain-containing protein n=1 Tax=unclassified Leptolyngbya TaxID=2650499 RepID=UPI001681BB61|nr:HD domain-containing protein [Leptolyngbya sp. FACHB-17]MBD2079411.1 HD domain-containing protein [Leptolyngbya sp. FACHB-17]
MQLTTTRLQAQIQFIVEIDKLKHVLRQTILMDKSRRENDAEHSWHLAMMAIVLAEYADPQVDLLRVLKMVLIHDLVEIDAGDTFCYDTIALQDQAEREEKAADRLFGMLPENLGAELRSLWEEFEAKETLDAQFATALDRLQPLLHNYYTEGGTWRKAGVTVEKVRHRMAPVAIGSSVLGEFVENLIQDAIRQGFILQPD